MVENDFYIAKMSLHVEAFINFKYVIFKKMMTMFGDCFNWAGFRQLITKTIFFRVGGLISIFPIPNN